MFSLASRKFLAMRNITLYSIPLLPEFNQKSRLQWNSPRILEEIESHLDFWLEFLPKMQAALANSSRIRNQITSTSRILSKEQIAVKFFKNS